MYRQRDNSGGLKFITEQKDNEQIRLLKRISDLERTVKQLKEEIDLLKVGFENVHK